MSNLLLMGKDLPDSLDFCEELSKNNRTVFTSSKPESEIINFESEKIYSCLCNKASAISAHSFIIKAETKLQRFDESIIIFDAPYFATRFTTDKADEISSAVDTMINSYLFFTSELLKRIDQSKEKAFVCFLLKTAPSKFELLSNSSKANQLPSTNIVTEAQALFETLAQNFATNVADRNYLNVLLAKKSYNSEGFQTDSEIADWITSSFDTLKNSKHPQTIKQALNWNKVGTKVSTGFSLFK